MIWKTGVEAQRDGVKVMSMGTNPAYNGSPGLAGPDEMEDEGQEALTDRPGHARRAEWY